MDKRSRTIAVISCILVIAGLAGYFLPRPIEANPTRLLMENPGGRVVFSHKAHSTPGGAYGDLDCAVCHHELKIAPAESHAGALPDVMRCTSCHGSAEDPDFIVRHQEEYRARGGNAACVSCHHATVSGLSENWNHEDHKNFAGDDCASCHHEERYEYRPGRFMNIKPQKCANCHTANPNPLAPTPLKKAAHARCQSCHSDLFDGGVSGCGTCHEMRKPGGDENGGSPITAFPACSTCHATVPSSMDAFHGRCMDCHEKKKKGPGKEAPCAQCHIP